MSMLSFRGRYVFVCPVESSDSRIIQLQLYVAYCNLEFTPKGALVQGRSVASKKVIHLDLLCPLEHKKHITVIIITNTGINGAHMVFGDMKTLLNKKRIVTDTVLDPGDSQLSQRSSIVTLKVQRDLFRLRHPTIVGVG